MIDLNEKVRKNKNQDLYNRLTSVFDSNKHQKLKLMLAEDVDPPLGVLEILSADSDFQIRRAVHCNPAWNQKYDYEL